MNELREDEKELLLQVMDGVILSAWIKWDGERDEKRRATLEDLCGKLASLGLHILDILQPSHPPTVH